MIADSDIVPRCIVAPGSFGGLMTLYEGNFIRLKSILPVVPPVGIQLVSRTPDDLDLFLSVESAARYTRELRLTYRFPGRHGLTPEPDLSLRLYLDAGMAEVRGWASSQQHGVLRTLHHHILRELDRRWAVNMMLGKWLEYLAERGHRFVTDSRPG